jgi:hypothetical protein
VQFYRVRHVLRLLRAGAACIVIFLFVSFSAAAQESVYGPAAPPGAGFVRVFFAASPAETVTVDIGNVAFGPVSGGAVTPYRPVSEGLYLLRLPGRETELFTRAGAYQTVLVTAEEIAVVPDRSHEDPAKAQLVLYNVSTRARVALVTAEAGQAVIPALAPLTGSAIAVNAVAVRFAVTVGNDDSPHTVEVAPFSLRRGASFSIFAFEPGEGVVTVVDQASVEVE